MILARNKIRIINVNISSDLDYVVFFTQPVERVQSLTSSSFAKVIAEGDHFVQFYTPFCRECKQTQEMWTEVAKHFASDGKLAVSKVPYCILTRDFRVVQLPRANRQVSQ